MSFRFRFSSVVIVPLLAFAAQTRAGLIDFETLPGFQNINGLDLGGVTISNPNNGSVVIYDNVFGVGYHSATKAISATDFMEITPKLVAVFDAPKDFVRLWSGNFAINGYVAGWQLEAFDAPVGGNSLELVQSGPWAGNPYFPLEISAPNIRRIEFGLYGGIGPGVGFDDLEFTPEPAAIALLLPLLTLIRRRR